MPLIKVANLSQLHGNKNLPLNMEHSTKVVQDRLVTYQINTDNNQTNLADNYNHIKHSHKNLLLVASWKD